ncbi:MAG TPA: hypothetical protein VH394_24885 [Thermoanaerobaculia bacterium]|jgi:hypothetical protein|nr:hypothetical protein [Thermoanaerobaculia bacterium]
MRRVLKVVGVLAGLALLGVLGMAGYMMYRMGPRDFFGMLRYDQREEGALAVGHAAPDVAVRALDGSQVSLRERFGGRPVVLIFGSYT